jgi:hypothetical protein
MTFAEKCNEWVQMKKEVCEILRKNGQHEEAEAIENGQSRLELSVPRNLPKWAK